MPRLYCACLYCACCGRPFDRKTTRGPAPLYCSDDCRRQMAVRRRVWSKTVPAERSLPNRDRPPLAA